MAAGYFKKLLEDRKARNVEVRAAGVLTVTGLKASQEARQIMEGEGIDLERHRSSQLSPEMIRRADLILGMTPYHVQIAQRICEDAKGKTFLLQEFTRADLKNVQIQDPMGCTLEVFKKRFKEIRQACDRLIASDFINGHSPVPIPAEARNGREKKVAREEAPKPQREKKAPTAIAKARPKVTARKKTVPKEVAAKTVSKSAAKSKHHKAKPARASKKSKPATKAAKAAKKLVRSKLVARRSKSLSRASSKRRI
jgi:protein-tyrosine phosphatase